MTGPDRRQALRLSLHLPVQVVASDGPIEASLQDISRTGARIRILMALLGLEPTEDMRVTAAMVARTLPNEFEARFHYLVLGSLVRRTVEITRLALPLDAADSIELGCSFDRPLTTDEVTMLGVPLPLVQGSEEDWIPRADVPAPFQRSISAIRLSRLLQKTRRPRPQDEPEAGLGYDPDHDGGPYIIDSADIDVVDPADVADPVETVGAGDAPRFATTAKQTHRAYVTGTAPEAPPSLLCHSDHLSRDAVRVRMSREGYEGFSVAEATMAFTGRIGSRAGLKLMDGHQHLWTGPVRVCSLELPKDRPGDMLVTLAFTRRLRPAEIRRLGLAADVA